MHDKALFPDIITQLPRADIPVAGIDSYLLQCADHQVVFMSFEKDIEIPEHSHEAQWGAVLDGEIELTVNGKSRLYKKGETYFIPKGVLHGARVKAGYKDVTLFNQNDRYGIREKKS